MIEGTVFCEIVDALLTIFLWCYQLLEVGTKTVSKIYL